MPEGQLKRRARVQTSRRRRTRCGTCGPCQVKEDCGTCKFCQNKQVLKQSCVSRKCVHLRGKRPRESQSPPDEMVQAQWAAAAAAPTGPSLASCAFSGQPASDASPPLNLHRKPSGGLGEGSPPRPKDFPPPPPAMSMPVLPPPDYAGTRQLGISAQPPAGAPMGPAPGGPVGVLPTAPQPANPSATHHPYTAPFQQLAAAAAHGTPGPYPNPFHAAAAAAAAVALPHHACLPPPLWPNPLGPLDPPLSVSAEAYMRQQEFLTRNAMEAAAAVAVADGTNGAMPFFPPSHRNSPLSRLPQPPAPIQRAASEDRAPSAPGHLDQSQLLGAQAGFYAGSVYANDMAAAAVSAAVSAAAAGLPKPTPSHAIPRQGTSFPQVSASALGVPQRGGALDNPLVPSLIRPEPSLGLDSLDMSTGWSGPRGNPSAREEGEIGPLGPGLPVPGGDEVKFGVPPREMAIESLSMIPGRMWF